MNIIDTTTKVLSAPTKPKHLFGQLHWLAGEGCGSWFEIENEGNHFLITRYDPQGKIECKGVFQCLNPLRPNLKHQFELAYLSHCAEVNFVQNNHSFKFRLLKKINCK